MNEYSKEWYTNHYYENELKEYLDNKPRKTWLLKPDNLPPEITNFSNKRKIIYKNESREKCKILYPCGYLKDGELMYACECKCGIFFLARHKSLNRYKEGISCGCKYAEKTINSEEFFKDKYYKTLLKKYLYKKEYNTWLFKEDNLPPKMKLSEKHTDYSDSIINNINIMFPCAYNEDKRVMYVCKCYCGNYFMTNERSITSNIKSCGCLTKEKTINRNLKNGMDILNTTIGLLHIDSFAGFEQLKNGHKRSLFNCTCQCGNKCIKAGTYLRQGNTQTCGLCGVKSIGEESIAKFLLNQKINFQHEYSFPDLLSKNGVLLRFDFAIFNDNNEILFLIEYDGQQHFPEMKKDFFEPYEIIHERDMLKNEYCLTNNIKLVRISYKENLEQRLEEIFNEL